MTPGSAAGKSPVTGLSLQEGMTSVYGVLGGERASVCGASCLWSLFCKTTCELALSLAAAGGHPEAGAELSLGPPPQLLPQHSAAYGVFI